MAQEAHCNRGGWGDEHLCCEQCPGSLLTLLFVLRCTRCSHTEVMSLTTVPASLVPPSRLFES